MNIPLHVFIANNIYPPIMAGGAELIVSYLAEGLVARGHRVTVISTCSPKMEPYPVEIRNGVEILRFFPKNLYWHWERDGRPGYQKILWHLRDAWNRDAERRFRAIVEEKKPDLLNTHLLDGLSASIWRRAKQAGIGVVHTAHDYHLLCPRAIMLTRSLKLCTKPTLACRFYRNWHLATTRDLDSFCSPSHFLIEQHKQAGLPVMRTSVLPNGIPPPVLVPGTREPGTPRRFLFAARHTVEKGCLVLLEAIKQMPLGLDFECWVAGMGPLEQKFRDAAATDPRIKLLGYIQDEAKDQVFKQVDCLLIPSLWYENAPVVIIEAAAYGLGVIGSRIGAIPEFVHDNETGLLFEAGNPAALAQAMQRIIREEGLLPRFAANTKPLVEASSVERMVDAYEAHYAEILQHATRRKA